jgi:hypothetical protein
MPRQCRRLRNNIYKTMRITATLITFVVLCFVTADAIAQDRTAELFADIRALRPEGFGRSNYGLASSCRPGGCAEAQRVYHARIRQILSNYGVTGETGFDRLFPYAESLAARVDQGGLTPEKADALIQQFRADLNAEAERDAERNEQSQQQADRFARDRYECQRDAITAAPQRIVPPQQPGGMREQQSFLQGAADGHVQAERQRLFTMCMNSRGYR